MYLECIANTLDSDLSTDAVVQWAIHKKQACIASGINKYCSMIDHELYDNTRRQTNAVEQTHHKSGSLGKRLSLLQAVKM
jgi:hypothetical protein